MAVDNPDNNNFKNPEIEGMLTRLHEVFADADDTPAQRQLIEEINARFNGESTDVDKTADDSPMDTLDQLAAEVELSHPAASAVLREVLRALRNMGV